MSTFFSWVSIWWGIKIFIHDLLITFVSPVYHPSLDVLEEWHQNWSASPDWCHWNKSREQWSLRSWPAWLLDNMKSSVVTFFLFDVNFLSIKWISYSVTATCFLVLSFNWAECSIPRSWCTWTYYKSYICLEMEGTTTLHIIWSKPFCCLRCYLSFPRLLSYP